MLFFQKKTKLKDLIPSGFTDVHSHVLPGIDDGAKTINDTITLVKRFQDLGINKIITTPHIISGLWPNSKKNIFLKVQDVRNRLKKEGLKDFVIEAAAEYMLDNSFLELLENKEIIPVYKNRVLVEMSYVNAPSNLLDMLFKVKIANFVPVIAHPERYLFYHNNKLEYKNLKRSGVEFQLNLLSLTNHYGKDVQKIAHYLIENEMYDLVGTDAHREKHLENINLSLSKTHLLLVKRLMEKNVGL